MGSHLVGWGCNRYQSVSVGGGPGQTRRNQYKFYVERHFYFWPTQPTAPNPWHATQITSKIQAVTTTLLISHAHTHHLIQFIVPPSFFFNPYLLVLTSYCHDGIGSGSGGPPPPPGPPAPAAPVATPFQTFTPQQPLSGGMGGPPPPPGPPAVGGGMGGPPPPPGQPRVMQVSTGT